jgi:hypothetical protein
MPLPLNDVEMLKEYINGVMVRAQHHANNVDEIAPAIAGSIVWRKDSDPIQVLARNGDMKNVLWVKISGKRYAFGYDHDTQTIQIKDGSTQGNLVASLSNSTTLVDLKRIFLSL